MSKLFSNIVGQNRAVGILSSHIANDSLSHAYVFVGDDGTGKEYLARSFSKYILCGNRKEDDCPDCHNFDKGVHPDFLFVDGVEGIKINQIREAIERMYLSPSHSSKKVLLINKSENLGIEAANAILKTLEEPPLDSVIILTAVSEKSLPETIVSRCQKIKLQPMSVEEIKEALDSEYTEAEIDHAIKYSMNNLGEAKKILLDPKVLAEREDLYSDIEIFLNSKSVIEKFKVVEKYDKTKNLDLGIFFEVFSRLIFVILADLVSENDTPGVVTISSDYSVGDIARIAAKILKIMEDLEYNINLKIALEEIILENSIS